MAGISTYTVNDLVRYARANPSLIPINAISGWSMEPALSIANYVLSFILSPPFSYPWNRNTTTFTASTSTQDNVVSALTAYGYIENANLSIAGTSPSNLTLNVRHVLGIDQTVMRPNSICVFKQDPSTGNVTFRLFPLSDQAYSVVVVFQQAPARLTALSGTFSPVPDQFFYLIEQGFIARSYEYSGDPRAEVAMDLFIRQVVAANTGLTETERNIFLKERLITQKDVQRIVTSRAELGMQVQQQPRGA
jgi:hypothetical protein